MQNASPRTTLPLISIVILMALSAIGCNRALPTEPEDSFATAAMPATSITPDRSPLAPAVTSPSVSVEAVGAATRSTRRRPARPTRPSPDEPASGESTPPTLDPSGPRNGGPGNPPPPPSTPPPPATSNKCGECDGVLRIPQESEYMAAVYAARDRVRSAVASGEIRANRKVSNWNVYPNVEWQACFFWVENGFYYDENGNKIVGACAAGMTDYAHRKIVIATQDQSRTVALVKWESTNYYLYLIGREDLLDRWQ